MLWMFEYVRDFLVQFRVSQYIIGLNPSQKLWSSECLWLPFPVSSILIYYGHQLKIRVKNYGHLNLTGASLFNFKYLDILWAPIRHPSQKLGSLEFTRGFCYIF